MRFAGGSGGGGNRTRVRGRAGQNLHKLLPRFAFARRVARGRPPEGLAILSSPASGDWLSLGGEPVSDAATRPTGRSRSDALTNSVRQRVRVRRSHLRDSRLFYEADRGPRLAALPENRPRRDLIAPVCIWNCSRGLAPLVLVDARNVLRSRWPNLTEEELAERIDAWAKREGQIAVVVFDGRALGKTGERRLSPACSLVGTGGESADDWIARRAAELAASGRPYWLVTSDRELRRRAGGAAERTIGGGSFVRTVAGD